MGRSRAGQIRVGPGLSAVGSAVLQGVIYVGEGAPILPRTPRTAPLAPLLAILLTACSVGGPTSHSETWAGTSSSGGVVDPLSLRTTRTPAGSWTGTYRLERAPAFTGAVEVRLAAGELTGWVVAARDCRFALAGQRTGDELTATFVPTDCPGGVGGTWSATLVSSTPGATSSEPVPDEETFDGGAAFDVARFR